MRGRPFQPGQSGNPGGRPRVAPELRQRLADLAPVALDTLAALLKDASAPPAARLRAAELVLAHAVGKPAPSTAQEDDDDAEVEEYLRRLAAMRARRGDPQ